MRTSIILIFTLITTALTSAENAPLLEARKYTYDDVREYFIKRDYSRVPWRSVTITSCGKDIRFDYIVATNESEAAKIFDLQVGTTSIGPMQINAEFLDRCAGWGDFRRVALSDNIVFDTHTENISGSDLKIVLHVIKHLITEPDGE